MVDMTLCMGNDCPMKNNCYRYVAGIDNDHPRQSWFTLVPFQGDCETVCCEYFIDMEG